MRTLAVQCVNVLVCVIVDRSDRNKSHWRIKIRTGNLPTTDKA